jgi:hypothetical protein
MRETYSMPVRTGFPSQQYPQGQMVQVHYVVNDGFVQLTDETGRIVDGYRRKIGEGESHRSVAARLGSTLRAHLSHESGFDRPLPAMRDPREFV